MNSIADQEPASSGLTTVVHCQREAFDVYIGRATVPFPTGSMWANEFRIGRDGNRTEVIAKFREWVLHSSSLSAQWMREHVHELRGKRLGCWCRPKACHGQVLAEMADAIKEDEFEGPAICPHCEHETGAGACWNPKCGEGRRNLADDRGDKEYHSRLDRRLEGD